MTASMEMSNEEARVNLLRLMTKREIFYLYLFLIPHEKLNSNKLVISDI